MREPTQGLAAPTPSTTSYMNTEDYSQRRSAAAVNIIQEANQLEAIERDRQLKGQGDQLTQGQTGDFDSWKQKAQQLVRQNSFFEKSLLLDSV